MKSSGQETTSSNFFLIIQGNRNNKNSGEIKEKSGEIIKIAGEAMIPYIARLLEITMNNGTLPGDWKRATEVPIHKGGARSLVTNYRPVSLTSVVCKQMELATVIYLRQVC